MSTAVAGQPYCPPTYAPPICDPPMMMPGPSPRLPSSPQFSAPSVASPTTMPGMEPTIVDDLSGGLNRPGDAAPDSMLNDPFTDDGSTNAAVPEATAAAPPALDPPITTADTSPAPPTNNFAGLDASNFQSNFASTRSEFSSAPTIIGDFFGGGLAQVSMAINQTFQFDAIGSGGLQPTFDRVPGGGFTPDILSDGPGRDGSGDSFNDTFSIAEPLPPTDAPLTTTPGATFAGGTATYTGGSGTAPIDGQYQSGDIWNIQYAFSLAAGNVNGGSGSRPIPSPGVAVRRIKISENFSPEVRNRFFVNYSFFNDTFGGLGDVSRFIVGTERVLIDDLVSLELRLPIAATYASEQEIAVGGISPAADRDMEIGNLGILGKLVLLRTQSLLWSTGLGIGTPTADDTLLTSRGQELIRIENQSVQILPFVGLLARLNREWTVQGYAQLDIDANGNPISANNNLFNPQLGQMQNIGRFNDSTLLHLDFAATRRLYQSRCQNASLASILGNAELHYTSTLQDSDLVAQNGVRYSNLQDRFDIVNATVGSHIVFNNGLVITPAMTVPLSTGLDEQFDYEATVQANFFY